MVEVPPLVVGRCPAVRVGQEQVAVAGGGGHGHLAGARELTDRRRARDIAARENGEPGRLRTIGIAAQRSREVVLGSHWWRRRIERVHEPAPASLDDLAGAVALDVGDRRSGEELPVLDLTREGRQRDTRRGVEGGDGVLEPGLLAGRPGGVGGYLGAQPARDDRVGSRAELSHRGLRDRPQERRVREVGPGSRAVGLQDRALAAVGVDRERGVRGVAAGQEHAGGGLEGAVAGRGWEQRRRGDDAGRHRRHAGRGQRGQHHGPARQRRGIVSRRESESVECVDPPRGVPGAALDLLGADDDVEVAVAVDVPHRGGVGDLGRARVDVRRGVVGIHVSEHVPVGPHDVNALVGGRLDDVELSVGAVLEVREHRGRDRSVVAVALIRGGRVATRTLVPAEPVPGRWGVVAGVRRLRRRAVLRDRRDLHREPRHPGAVPVPGVQPALEAGGHHLRLLVAVDVANRHRADDLAARRGAVYRLVVRGRQGVRADGPPGHRRAVGSQRHHLAVRSGLDHVQLAAPLEVVQGG